MQHDDESVGATVEGAVELTAVVAAQLFLDLRAVRERQMRDRVVEQVETVDLIVQRRLLFVLGTAMKSGLGS